MATWTYAEGEAKRKDFMVFWVTDGNASTIKKDTIEIIGKGVEDMPISMNPETEESQDVLGNNNYDITGYAESMTVDPTNISGENKYSQKIDTLMEERATLSDLRLKYLCVKRYKTDSTGKMRAWVQDGVVELGDFAGGLKGVSATHTVHYVGDRTLGAVDPSTMTFTADRKSTRLNSSH